MNKTRFLAHACLSEVKEHDLESLYKIKSSTDLVKLSKQKDLLGIESVLVSTGMNRNDDVFVSEELAPIADTGAHKPMNIEHDEEKIVGHIVESFLTTKGGKAIESLDDLPQSFDITNRAVLYKYIYSDLAEEVKRRADNNSLFVSVEMWFSHYDYSVGNKVFERNPETERHLEACLRCNGGNGKFEDKRVGRVLRNMLIAGIGLVKTPANPESVIRSVGSYHFVSDPRGIFDVNIKGDVDYIVQSNPKEDKIMDISKITEEVTKIVSASLEKETPKAESLSEVVEDSKKTEAHSEQLEKYKEQIERLEKVVQTLELDRRVSQRREKLRSLNMSDKFVEAKLQECIEMSDSDFDSFIAHAKSILDDISASSETTVLVEDAEVEDEVEDKSEAEDKTEDNEKESEVDQVVASDDADISLDDVTPLDTNLNIEDISDQEDESISTIARIFEERLCSHNPRLKSGLEK